MDTKANSLDCLKDHRRVCAIACVTLGLLLILGGGCNPKEKDATTVDGAPYTPLPDPIETAAGADTVRLAQLGFAQGHLDHTRSLASNLGVESGTPLSLCETADRYLADAALFGKQPPLVVLACVHPALDDSSEAMFLVESLNTNRETHKIIIVFRKAEEVTIRLEGRIPLTEKSPLLVTSETWYVAPVGWQALRDRAAEDPDGDLVIRITLDKDTRIPMTLDPDTYAVVAVEDRTGRLSNFTLVSRAWLNKARQESASVRPPQ